MLTIIGGTYFEYCQEPYYYEIYGSGLRAAAALSNLDEEIKFISCVGEQDIESVKSICAAYKIDASFHINTDTVLFNYYHPLSKPTIETNLLESDITELDNITSENILFFGMNEATVKIQGNYVVYDPQNGIPFSATLSTAKHLAIILNRKEAIQLSGLSEDTDLNTVGKSLMISESADVIVIKNGSSGALVFDNSSIYEVPVFRTLSVWPIGSGDIFSSVFAWKWILEKLSPFEAALYASRYTAQFCETQRLPLSKEPIPLTAIPLIKKQRKIYLAGPFFTMSERWLINELRSLLIDFGNDVFSPFHNVGLLGSPQYIVEKDLEGLIHADVILAVINGLDTGTIFEIGYAKALSKRVVVFTEDTLNKDLIMLIGSNCEITTDLTTAIYTTSW